MIPGNFDYKIASSTDIEAFKPEKNLKLNSLQLDFKGGNFDKTKFTDFFTNKLSHAKDLHKVELDFTRFGIDNHTIELITEFLSGLKNLREVDFHISECKLTNTQFDKLLNDSLGGKTSMTKLHLNMENVDINEPKRKSIEKLIKSMPNLVHSHINMQRNTLSKSDLDELHGMINHMPYKVILW